jgi:multiple sugar transport system permease protein
MTTVVDKSAPVAPPRQRLNKHREWTVSRVVVSIVAILGAVAFLLPLWFMFRTSVMSLNDAFYVPIRWIPNRWIWSNYSEAVKFVSLGHYYVNSVIVATLVTIGAVVSSSITAYGFSMLRAPGRDGLFLMVITGLMIPAVVTMVPTYVIYRQIGWLNTWLPLTVPSWFGGGAFSIFLLRQFYRTIPRELREAALVDGANEFRIYRQIIVPLALPGHAAVAIFAFLWSWNDLFGPLIYLNSQSKQTLPIALAAFVNTQSVTQWQWMMAATLLAMLPCVVVFLAAQKYFIRGIVLSGLKG